jgi:hypothetical protein
VRFALAVTAFAVTLILALLLALFGFPPLFRLAQDGVVRGEGLFLISAEITRTLADAGISEVFLALAAFYSRLTGWLAFVITGTVIYLVRPRDRAAVVTSIMLISVGTALMTPLALAVEANTDLRSAVALIGTPSVSWPLFGRSVAGVSALLAMLILPDGRFVPRWTRWLAAGVLTVAVLWAVFPESIFAVSSWPSALRLLWIGGVPLTGAASQLYRYLKVSTPDDRRKTRAVLAAVVLATAAFVGLVVFDPELGAGLFDLGVVTPEVVAFYEIILLILLGLAVVVLPISVAWSVLRHRLFDVRVLANRALVYAVVTALMAAIGLFVVFVVSRTLGLLLGDVLGTDVALVASTIVVTLLFGPARRWVGALIDRAFYRRRYDAAQVLEEFRRSIVSAGSLDNCSTALGTIVQTTMQPRMIRMWVRPDVDETKWADAIHALTPVATDLAPQDS